MFHNLPEQVADAVQVFSFQDQRYVFVGPIRLPVAVQGDEHVFRWYGFSRLPSDLEPDLQGLVKFSEQQQTFSSLLVYGDFEEQEMPAVRVHSVCQTGDVFGSLRCDCGPQLQRSLQKIVKRGVGALVYLAQQEGRGIGLLAKVMTYKLQEAGFDTFEANRMLGCQDDCRTYEEAAAGLAFLRESRPVTLLTNNPVKVEALREHGISVVVRDDHTVPASLHNYRYLQAKISSGHVVDVRKLAQSIASNLNK